jgi:hypothetical protein
MSFTVPSTANLKKTILFSVLKIFFKKFANQENSFHEWHFVEWKNGGRKTDKNSRLRRLEFMPRNLD